MIEHEDEIRNIEDIINNPQKNDKLKNKHSETLTEKFKFNGKYWIKCKQFNGKYWIKCKHKYIIISEGFKPYNNDAFTYKAFWEIDD